MLSSQSRTNTQDRPTKYDNLCKDFWNIFHNYNRKAVIDAARCINLRRPRKLCAREQTYETHRSVYHLN